MRVDIDRTAILNRDKISFQEDISVDSSNDPGKNFIAVGFRKDNEIFLPPSTFLETLGTYLHEVGHIIGDTLSFQADDDDVTGTQVLSIDDVKNPYEFISLSRAEQEFLRENIGNKNDLTSSNEYITSIANKLLIYFTNGLFDPEKVIVNFVSRERLNELISGSNINTILQDADGKRYARNSKEGRNSEIPAYVTEFCCLKLFENTLYQYRILDRGSEFIISTTPSMAHQRAKNLFSRAFKGKGWRLPSMIDTRRKEDLKKSQTDGTKI